MVHLVGVMFFKKTNLNDADEVPSEQRWDNFGGMTSSLTMIVSQNDYCILVA